MIGKSLIPGAGVGLFTVWPIRKKQLVSIYLGELITGDESDKRDTFGEIDKILFLFEINRRVSFTTNHYNFVVFD